MKKILIVVFICPCLAFAQNDTMFDTNGKILSINQNGINKLMGKYKKVLKSKGGIDGWKLQIKFTSKREDITPYQIQFTNSYPEIPAQITFEYPYYKLIVGNFRTKNKALKAKHKINKKFPGAHPISTIIDTEILRK